MYQSKAKQQEEDQSKAKQQEEDQSKTKKQEEDQSPPFQSDPTTRNKRRSP
jgi:hypothetical protein